MNVASSHSAALSSSITLQPGGFRWQSRRWGGGHPSRKMTVQGECTTAKIKADVTFPKPQSPRRCAGVTEPGLTTAASPAACFAISKEAR